MGRVGGIKAGTEFPVIGQGVILRTKEERVMSAIQFRILVLCSAICFCTFGPMPNCIAGMIAADAMFAHNFESISGNSIASLTGPSATATAEIVGSSFSPVGFGSSQHVRAAAGSAYPAIDTNTRLTSSTSALSFSIFFNDRGDNGGDMGGNVARLLSSYSGPGSPPNQLDFSVINSRQLVLFVEGQNVLSSAAIPYADADWHQAGFVFDGGTLTFYFDGVQLGAQLAVGSSVVSQQTNNWFLLNTPTPFGDEYFDGGDYDEAALWTRALNASDMNSLYSNGLSAISSVPEPGSIALWGIGMTVAMVWRKRRKAPSRSPKSRDRASGRDPFE